MKRTYLQTNEEIDYFYENYKALEAGFPILDVLLTNQCKELIESPSEQSEISVDFDCIECILNRQVQVAEDTLYLDGHHAATIPLSEESLEHLRYILRSAQEELSKVQFVIQQVYDHFQFRRAIYGKTS